MVTNIVRYKNRGNAKYRYYDVLFYDVLWFSSMPFYDIKIATNSIVI